MPVDNRDMVEAGIIALIKNLSGRKVVHIEQMIGKDVGVYGLDGILLAEKIEEMFDLDLSPFIEQNSKFLPPNWWDRLRGRVDGPRYTDVKIKDLVEYVTVHAGEGMNEAMPRFF